MNFALEGYASASCLVTTACGVSARNLTRNETSVVSREQSTQYERAE